MNPGSVVHSIHAKYVTSCGIVGSKSIPIIPDTTIKPNVTVKTSQMVSYSRGNLSDAQNSIAKYINAETTGITAEIAVTMAPKIYANMNV